MVLNIINGNGRPKYNEIRVAYLLQVCLISPYIFTVGMNLYVLLGKPVYRRWFLDGSDPNVRLVGLYVSGLFNVGGEAGAGGGGGGGGLAFYALPLLSDFKRFYATTTSLLSSL